jgi:hypothetical protein
VTPIKLVGITQRKWDRYSAGDFVLHASQNMRLEVVFAGQDSYCVLDYDAVLSHGLVPGLRNKVLLPSED